MGRLTTLKPRVQALGRPLQAVDTWRSGLTTGQRGYNYRWQKARERHLSCNPLCVMCLEERLISAATVVDHRVPHRGDQSLFWDESNWQSLCATHHSSTKQRQENAAG